MRLVFARHGNTFAPGDRVVWVGRRTDLPLVARGEEQAREAAAGLARAGFVPDAVYCASLRRTRGFAEIVAGALAGAPDPIVDDRLDEIDYGAWEGLTAEEVAARPGGGDMLAAWVGSDAWPEGAGWRSTREEVSARVRGFIAERLGGAAGPSRVLVVGSNGVLRFFPRLLDAAPPPAGAPASYQLKTGHLGLVAGEGGRFRIERWNVSPASL
ncbi:MAG: histidine phosphatase family protein [Proteobacteria bacterium]|nr:histidine phosphatase family protein [Pseudomonadota bacterium]